MKNLMAIICSLAFCLCLAGCSGDGCKDACKCQEDGTCCCQDGVCKEKCDCKDCNCKK